MTRYWHPFADMAAVRRDGELVLVRGSGSTLVDSHGREYLDAAAGLWYCNVGHGRGSIADAAAEQMRRLASCSTFGDVAADVTLELADRVVACSPHPNGSLFLTSGGSDAVDTSLKLALRYWQSVGQPGRNTVIRRSGAYHGMHLGGTTLAGIPANRIPLPDGGIRCVEVPWNDADALDATIDGLGAEQVAAFFCEPVQGAGGVFAPPPGYLAGVEEVCRHHGVLFVLDEVITGFGRLGEWFGAHRYGLRPDLLTFAKGITSGYVPLGGVLVSPRVMEPFWSTPGTSWRHGYTYSGHATAAAAALANLDVLADEGLLAHAEVLETQLRDALGPLERHDLVAEVRSGTGAMAAIQLDASAMQHDPTLGDRVVRAIRDQGVLTRIITGGALQISPPLVMTSAEVATMAAGIAAGLADCQS